MFLDEIWNNLQQQLLLVFYIRCQWGICGCGLGDSRRCGRISKTNLEGHCLLITRNTPFHQFSYVNMLFNHYLHQHDPFSFSCWGHSVIDFQSQLLFLSPAPAISPVSTVLQCYKTSWAPPVLLCCYCVTMLGFLSTTRVTLPPVRSCSSYPHRLICYWR